MNTIPKETSSTETSFAHDLGRFGSRLALIEAATGQEVTYSALEALVQARMHALQGARSLAFIEAKNTVKTVVNYLAAVRCRHVSYLVEDIRHERVSQLTETYRPRLVLTDDETILSDAAVDYALHPKLSLLLSTSGSTGSPKFVKLSLANLHANATSIAEYLRLDDTDRAYHHLKTFYSYGLSVVNSHLAVGAALVLTDNSVASPDQFWGDFRTFGATSFAGVPFTFETIAAAGFDPTAFPSLRYATQAGGKLGPDLVTHFATTLQAADRRFYVMYGQTEASPRISYLPPELALRHPTSIGRAIPGGRLLVVDDDGNPIETIGTPGQLAYEGPNVMMGYATTPAALAGDETPQRLLTGDLAVRIEGGLFEITGRLSRIVKPLGLRVNLDDLQAMILRVTGIEVVATGNDKCIALATRSHTRIPLDQISAATGVPRSLFHVTRYDEYPRLPNGKLDYMEMIADAQDPNRNASVWTKWLNRIGDILGVKTGAYGSIDELFNDVLGRSLQPSESIASASYDSLAFVELTLGMEALFGEDLPEHWHEMSYAELEKEYIARRVAA